MDSVLNRRELLDLRDKYVRELEQDDNPVELKLRLAAMAHAIQITMCLPSTQKAVRKSDAIELIMRGVAHAIEGDTKNDYILSKIRIGLACLE